MQLDDVIEQGLIEAHLQPVVDLATGAVVAHEALARGPRGTDLERPDLLFEAAREADRLAELDQVCLRAALAAGCAAGCETLFVNVESPVFDGTVPDVPTPPRVVVEVTERAILDRPAELLIALDAVRARGWSVAVDDLGATWGSLALLPLLRPDVVKLDRGVLAHGGGRAAARVIRAARAYVDRTGAALVSEGIEEAGHEQRAVAFGATLGQGWRYGRPVPAAEALPATAQAPPPLAARSDPPGTPFELLVRSGLPRAVGTKAELLPFSRDLESEGEHARDPMVLLGTFQTADRFTPHTRVRYGRYAEGAALVAAFGVGLSEHPVPGVRGADLLQGETLAGEWVVAVVGAHQAAALIARDLGDVDVPDRDRRFEYALVSNRTLVESCARSLLRRVGVASATLQPTAA